jgi:hypothetical protein
MPTLATSALTLTDAAKRTDPDGSTSLIAELLSQTNEALQDVLWVPGNLPTGHQASIRTGLPTVYWRQINQGVPASKSRTAQVTETCGRIEAWSEVDEALVELYPDSERNAFRMTEAQAFIEAMSQEAMSTLLYGNQLDNPEEITGLTTRYSSLSAENGENIISAGSVTGSDEVSIWLVGWGDNTVFGVYPKNTRAGLEVNDLGKVTVETTAGIAGSRMRAYQMQFVWRCGLMVKDWRYAVRIANIDSSALVGDGAGSTVKLLEYMTRAVHKIPNINACRPVFYAPRTVRAMLDVQAMNKANVQLQVGQEEGRMKTTFHGIPIRTCDALITGEGQAS